MEYTVTDKAGQSVKVEAENWLLAAASSLSDLAVDINGLRKLVCTPRKDGSVMLEDPSSGAAWTIEEKKPEPQIQIKVSARSATYEEPEDDFQREEDEDPSEIFEKPPPALSIPTTSIAREPVNTESLAERLFDLSMDMLVAEPEEAFGMALDLLGEYVPSKSVVAVRGTMGDDILTAVEARGAGANEVGGRTIPFGEGLTGMCFDMRETIKVDDVSRSIPYEARYDGVKAFDVGCALVVPVLDETTLVYGVLVLLNPRGRAFLDEDVDAVETIARTVGQALANR